MSYIHQKSSKNEKNIQKVDFNEFLGSVNKLQNKQVSAAFYQAGRVMMEPNRK